jgi:hypothetical protein
MLVDGIKVQSAWKKHRAERIVILKRLKVAGQHVLRIDTIREEWRMAAKQSYVKTLYGTRN